MIVSQRSIHVSPTIEENTFSELNENLILNTAAAYHQEDVVVAAAAKARALLNYYLVHLLSSPNVYIRDLPSIENKLFKILLDGRDNLHLISDFDMTITKYWYQGKKSPSSHDILSNSSKVSEKYHKRCNELKNKFYPIEIAPNMTEAEKLPYMIEWWRNANQAIIDEKIHKDTIKDMARETQVVYRPGIKDVIHTCKSKHIPLLVFSAGVQNVIKETLIQGGLYFDNMNVVSNKMLFNPETGICDRFADPLIHIFNKDNFGLEGTNYENLIKNRKNVIICGDSLGDLKMADGVEHETSLSIGFLNINKEKMLETYKKNFDIVISDDGSFDLLNEFLNLLL